MGQLPRFYHVANWVLRNILFRLFLSLKVRGVEKVPRTGSLIVIINHINVIDPPMAGALLPREIEMMSKIENFRLPFWGWVVKHYGAFPIRRGEADVAAIRHALRILGRGGALLMAPEGRRGAPVLKDAHAGVALLAARSGAPILPVGIAGQENVPANLKRFRRTQVLFTVGDPFYLDAGTRRPSRETLEAMTEELMQRLAAQLPEPYRGPYRPETGPGRFARPAGHLLRKELI